QPDRTGCRQQWRSSATLPDARRETRAACWAEIRPVPTPLPWLRIAGQAPVLVQRTARADGVLESRDGRKSWGLLRNLRHTHPCPAERPLLAGMGLRKSRQEMEKNRDGYDA